MEFPERTILLIKTSLSQLASSSLLLSKISEIRKSKTTAEFFDQLDVGEQVQWSKDLIDRVNIQISEDSPCISILDTGVNIGHPLLSPFVAPNSTFVINPNWGTSDINGHGTSMAGLAIWGDLSHALDGNFSIDVKHQVESIKLLRQQAIIKISI